MVPYVHIYEKRETAVFSNEIFALKDIQINLTFLNYNSELSTIKPAE